MVAERLSQLLSKDSQRELPIIQGVSLFFRQSVPHWQHRICVEKKPFVIAIAGPSGSGKSYLREALVERLNQFTDVSAFTQDNYYRDFEADFPDVPLERFYHEVDFDDPCHIRFRQLRQDLRRIRSSVIGSVIRIEQFRFGTPSSKPTIIPGGCPLKVNPFIITEGIHAFYDPTILPLYDLKIYVDVDEKTRKQRWLERNRRENRGTTDNMWNTTVACLERHILPTRSLADVIINNQAPKEAVCHFLTEVLDALVPAKGLGQEIA
ncbi:MAG TPA: hypothetical protein V6C99_04210 [Oculatellaceae cyanobacterium]|jgi:uridine kinase